MKIFKTEKALGFLVKSILRLRTILFIFGSFLALIFEFQLILSYKLQRIRSYIKLGTFKKIYI